MTFYFLLYGLLYVLFILLFFNQECENNILALSHNKEPLFKQHLSGISVQVYFAIRKIES